MMIVASSETKVTQDILDAEPNGLEINTMKILIMYEAAIRKAADDGKVAYNLWWLVWWLARKWRADTQEVEGLHLALKAQLAKAPNITLALVSARLSIRKALNIIGGKGPTAKKWSLVAPVADALVAEASGHFEAAQEIVAEVGRWEAPTARRPKPPCCYATTQMGMRCEQEDVVQCLR